jgi:uncharacterized protein involved in exopolysaccharide biosynthesis
MFGTYMTNNEMKKQNEVGSFIVSFITSTVRFRWLLFWIVLIITGGSILYALMAPKWYKSTASVLLSEKNDLLSSLSGLSSLAKGFSASKGLAALTGKNSESDRYLAILMSATLNDEIIKKFKLREEYNMEDDYYEKVVKEWNSNLDLEVQPEGNLTITVFSKSPQKAANIANYMITRLNEINTELSASNAKANSQFIEKRYLQNMNDINNYEDSMKKFQIKYGVVAVPEQIEATVKSMSEIYLEYYKKEVAFNVLSKTYGKDHPLVLGAKVELSELSKKIDDLNNGTDPFQKDVKLFIPFKEAPALGNEYLKIYRSLEIQYKILEFVQPLYEQAKIEEVRNTPSVIILDKAFPADRKSKPKGSIYGAVGLVVSSIIGFFIIYLLIFLEKMKKYNRSEYDYIVQTLRGDFKTKKKLKSDSI